MSIKLDRLGHTFTEEISKVINEEVKDEDINFVTITAVDISSDLSYAKVYFTNLIDKDREKVTKALNRASSFIRGKLFDKVEINISKTINILNKVLYKSEFIKKYSKKYKKYITSANQINKNSIDFISSKILFAVICVIIAIFSKTIQFKIFRIHDIYIPFILYLVYHITTSKE
jgi:ribosome-binding factor A